MREARPIVVGVGVAAIAALWLVSSSSPRRSSDELGAGGDAEEAPPGPSGQAPNEPTEEGVDDASRLGPATREPAEARGETLRAEVAALQPVAEAPDEIPPDLLSPTIFQQWSRESRDEKWARPEQARIAGILGQQGVPVGYRVSCRTTLCRIGPPAAGDVHGTSLEGTSKGTLVPGFVPASPEEIEATARARERLMGFGHKLTTDAEEHGGVGHEIWYVLRTGAEDHAPQPGLSAVTNQ